MNKRRSGRGRHFRIESLESRRTPSAAPSSLALLGSAPSGVNSARLLVTSPGDGETVEASKAPNELVLRLEGLPPETLTYQGLMLLRVAPDGSETTILDGEEEEGVQFGKEPGTLSVSLKSTLEVGRYRVALASGSALSRMLASGRWDPRRDQTLSRFEVTMQGPSDKEAETIGSKGRVVVGSLTGDAAAEATFRIRLGNEQPLWRLGLQLDAGRIGSDLLASMKVYDAEGRLLASARIGDEIPLGIPNDPYLFAGLAPGEYQVVVSKPEGRPGGDFRLNLVADAAPAPARVTGFAMDRAGGQVGGFSITFSSPIDPARLATDSIRVVDAAGEVHHAFLSGLDPSFTRMDYVFASPLPAGEYRLLAAGEEPLADLIGRIPTADGLPPATLATWTVNATESTSGKAQRPGRDRGEVSLRPGESAQIPLSLDDLSLLVLRTNFVGAVSVEVVGSDGVVVRSLGTTSKGGEIPLILPAGRYVIRLTGTGTERAKGSWRIDSGSDRASLIGNAIGNRGVIDVRLRTGGPSGPLPEAMPSSSIQPPPVPQPQGRLTPAAAVSGRAEGVYASGALPVSSESTPLGKPAMRRDDVPIVGPTVPGGRNAVAWSSAGKGQAIASLLVGGGSQADDGASRGPAGLPEPQPRGSSDGSTPDRAADPGDQAALRKADRAAGVLTDGLRWLVDGPEPARAPTSTPADAGRVVVARAIDPSEAAAVETAPGEASDGKVERASLEVPIGVLLVTTSTFHLRRAALRWWRKRKAAAAGPLQVPEPRRYRGPRRIVPSKGSRRSVEPRRD